MLASIGALLAFAGAEYAIYAHYVEPLPADRWAGWVGEWASAPIVLVPAVALLLFPTGAPPSRAGARGCGAGSPRRC